MTTPTHPYARRREQIDQLLDPRPKIVCVRYIEATKPEPCVVRVVRRDVSASEEITPSP